MDWKDIAAKVTSAAPLVGSLFGPTGTIIGAGIKLLASALGVEPTEEAVYNELKTNPDALLKLKELEANNRIELERLSIRRLELEYADVASARSRQVESEKATGHRDTNLYILAWVIMGGFLGLILAMIIAQFRYDKILMDNPLLTLLMGSLSTNAGMVVGYFFGSSKSSSDKTELLSKK